ncbi:MAG: response regulator [Candidatus Nanopelagicales bacterium]|nr:response regulator [Candidatus Nanopelagicales bacterium]MCF8538186.1 response regulator [Candidatus Nanopelagicales bacterium]MCF8543244.1 response regulator [Candidatus Nanopelagicales bacterium]
MPLRLLIVDDDDFSRTTVSAALAGQGFTVMATASGVADAMSANVSEIDVAVLDLDLGEGPNGIDLAHALAQVNPALGIVLLTSFSDPRLLAASVRELPPHSSYVVKQSLRDIGILVEAVRATGSPEAEGSQTPRVPLTDAQVETLRLLAYGLSNAEIARVRVVSEKSVEQAIKRAATALDIPSDATSNQRVALARAFFSLTGATRHRHAHR